MYQETMGTRKNNINIKKKNMSKHKDNQDKGLPSWFPAPNVTLPIGYGTDFSSATYKAFTMDDSLIQTLQTGQRYVHQTQNFTRNG